MAKTSNDKKTASSSSSSAVNRRAGEKVGDVQTPIRFYTKDRRASKDDEEDTVEIPVKIDPTGNNDRSNTTKVAFPRLSSFADAGEKVIELRRDMNVKLYRPMGLVESSKMITRLRYLTMTLGTTAVQQISTAIIEAFKSVSKAMDATMTNEQREEISRNEISTCNWLSKPRHIGWNSLPEESKQELIQKANDRVENQVWFQLYSYAYPEFHSEALSKFDKYLKTQLIKPYG